MNEIRIGNKSDAIGLLDSLLSEARKNLVEMYSDWDELDISNLIPTTWMRVKMPLKET